MFFSNINVVKSALGFVLLSFALKLLALKNFLGFPPGTKIVMDDPCLLQSVPALRSITKVNVCTFAVVLVWKQGYWLHDVSLRIFAVYCKDHRD